MQNNIGKLDSNSLIECGQNDEQTPIYLIVDWESETVDVIVKNYYGSVPAREYYGFVSTFEIPKTVNAEKLESDINEYFMPRINALYEEYQEYYDGSSNHRAGFTETGTEMFWKLSQDLEVDNGYLSILDDDEYIDYLIDAGVRVD